MPMQVFLLLVAFIVGMISGVVVTLTNVVELPYICQKCEKLRAICRDCRHKGSRE